MDPEAETLDMVNTLRLEGEVRKAESLEAKRRGDRLNAIEQGADGFAVRERKLAAQIAHAKYVSMLWYVFARNLLNEPYNSWTR